MCTLAVSYNVVFGTTAAVVYYCFYALTVFFIFALVGLLEGGFYAVGRFYNAARCLVCCLALSLAGVPPFVGFYLKLFLFTSLAAQSLWYTTAFAAVGSILSLVFYGRLVLRNMPDLSGISMRVTGF